MVKLDVALVVRQKIIEQKLISQPEMHEMKRCSRCGDVKELNQFYKDSRIKNGKKAHCKVCDKVYVRSPQRFKNAAIKRKENKNWGNKNRKPSALKRKYNPSKKAEYDKKYRSSEKGKSNCKNRKYKYRSLNKDSNFKIEDWRKLLSGFDNKCAYCGSENDMSIDHIIPISKEGTSHIYNLLPACRQCNRKKGVKNIHDFCSPEKIAEIKRILSTIISINQSVI